MTGTLPKTILWTLTAGFIISAFLYIIFIIQPELIFHHSQPPFIISSVYFNPFLKYPGGTAELLANLFLQSFYYKFPGSFVFLLIALFIGW